MNLALKNAVFIEKCLVEGENGNLIPGEVKSNHVGIILNFDKIAFWDTNGRVYFENGNSISSLDLLPENFHIHTENSKEIYEALKKMNYS